MGELKKERARSIDLIISLVDRLITFGESSSDLTRMSSVCRLPPAHFVLKRAGEIFITIPTPEVQIYHLSKTEIERERQN